MAPSKKIAAKHGCKKKYWDSSILSENMSKKGFEHLWKPVDKIIFLIKIF